MKDKGKTNVMSDEVESDFFQDHKRGKAMKMIDYTVNIGLIVAIIMLIVFALTQAGVIK